MKHKILIMLRLIHNISIVLELTHIFKTNVTAKLAVLLKRDNDVCPVSG